MTVGSKTWTRVENMGVDVRIAEEGVVFPPDFELKNLSPDVDTTEYDLFEMLLPMPIDEMLEVVKYRARMAGDKYGEHWYREHIIAFFLCLFGGSLYKAGTDLWTKEACGLQPAPDFGTYLTKDRFERVRRSGAG